MRKGCRGDVLLEYVVITTLIVLPLVAVGSMLFNPTGIAVTDPLTGQRITFGLFGDAFVGFYQRLIEGIRLPVP